MYSIVSIYKIKITMARRLTSDAKKKVMDDASLYADICLICNLKPGSLSQLLGRNSKRLISHDAVVKISEAMNKQPEDILEEIPLPATV